MATTQDQAGVIYPTWYDFKRNLELKTGRFLNVDLWLLVKPKKPLPWNSDDFNNSLVKFNKHKAFFMPSRFK
jgi:hypothetical protein